MRYFLLMVSALYAARGRLLARGGRETPCDGVLTPHVASEELRCWKLAAQSLSDKVGHTSTYSTYCNTLLEYADDDDRFFS